MNHGRAGFFKKWVAGLLALAAFSGSGVSLAQGQTQTQIQPASEEKAMPVYQFVQPAPAPRPKPVQRDPARKAAADKLALSGWTAFQKTDYATAARDWRRAADLGNAFAQYHLGWLYETGRGVALDYGQAAHWYQVADQSGWPTAARGLQRLNRNR